MTGSPQPMYMRLNYADENVKDAYNIDTDNTSCIENCTSCLDTKCIFHETNRDIDEYKELARELRRKIAEVV